LHNGKKRGAGQGEEERRRGESYYNVTLIPSAIPDAVLKKLKVYTEHPQFDPHAVAKVFFKNPFLVTWYFSSQSTATKTKIKFQKKCPKMVNQIFDLPF
jgi:hypothetical protein